MVRLWALRSRAPVGTLARRTEWDSHILPISALFVQGIHTRGHGRGSGMMPEPLRAMVERVEAARAKAKLGPLEPDEVGTHNWRILEMSGIVGDTYTVAERMTKREAAFLATVGNAAPILAAFVKEAMEMLRGVDESVAHFWWEDGYTCTWCGSNALDIENVQHGPDCGWPAVASLLKRYEGTA